MNHLEFFEQCTIEGNIVKFPEIQLDRETYLVVQDRLSGIGGKWSRRDKGFKFASDPTNLFALIREGKKYNLKKEFQAFFTPELIAQMIVELADIQTHQKILEPSAGQGALVDQIPLDMIDRGFVEIECCELQEINRDILMSKGYKVIAEDFLTLNRPGYYDKIIANPPFTKNQDIDHFRHMYECLNEGGRIVSVMSCSWQTGSQKKQVAFREWLDEIGSVYYDLESGWAKESGTMVPALVLIADK